MTMVILTIVSCLIVLVGIFVPYTIHVEIQFDSATVDPSPWWRPFMWWRWKEKENGFVVRVGILGFHFCVAMHRYNRSEWK